MRSIKRRFNAEVKHRPFHSSYICFAEAVKRQGFSRRNIGIWFRKLVDKDDYQPSLENGLINHMCNLSNMPEERAFQTENAPGDAKSTQMSIDEDVAKKDRIIET